MDAPRERWLGVELRHLAALEAIAREGSFQAAADALGYVPSAISQQIAQLESRAGARLIERSAGSAPVSLTPAGELVLEHFGAITERLRAAERDLASIDDDGAEAVRVGAPADEAPRLLAKTAAALAQVRPDVRVVPTDPSPGASVLETLAQGHIDLALCELPVPDGPYAHDVVGEDPYVLVVASGSPLAERGPQACLEQAGHLPLIARGDTAEQRAVVTALTDRGITPRFAHRADRSSAAQTLVASDLGVAILPALAVDPMHPGTTTLELPDLPPRQIAAVWSTERPPAQATLELVRALHESWSAAPGDP